MPKFTFPPEWSPHVATWIAWPHHEPDWPGKLGSIPWVYTEIARILAQYEQVEILCQDASVHASAQEHLAAHGVNANVRLHIVPTDRVWLRDSAPTMVYRADGIVELVDWGFNAWAKYDNYSKDADIGRVIERTPFFSASMRRRKFSNMGEASAFSLKARRESIIVLPTKWI